MGYGEYSEEKSDGSFYNLNTRTSFFWKEGKVLLHKNGMIVIEKELCIVYPNDRKGKKIYTTTLQKAYDYLLNIEYKEGELNELTKHEK